jgi:glycine oxidase
VVSIPDVAVVGGGVIGLASAWRLAEQGLSVTVIDPEPGSGASTVAAGMLAPVTEARLGEEELLQLGLAALARWDGFAAALEDASGRSVGHRADGTVCVAFDADDRAILADVVDRERSMGLAVGDLSSGQLRDLEPGLAPQVRRGAFAADERSVDPVALVDALLVAARKAGVELRPQRVAAVDVTPASSPEGTGTVARGVVLDDGERVAAGTVVLAAGSWSPQVTGLPLTLVPPVRPVKGQVVTLRHRPDDIVVRHTVRGYARGSAIYLVPRDDGRLVCGATVEERGWDATVTAGGAYELLRDVLSLFPGLDEAELVTVQSGFRPGTPDDRPLVGPSGIESLIMATGHYRNGILLTPVTAEAVVAFVTGGEPPAEVASCDPRRFVRDVVL